MKVIYSILLLGLTSCTTLPKVEGDNPAPTPTVIVEDSKENHLMLALPALLGVGWLLYSYFIEKVNKHGDRKH